MSKRRPSTDELVTFAHELARRSGEVILPYFRQSITVDNKLAGSGFDPVTAADRAAEEVIRAAILERYPDHGIVGEELGTANASSPLAWVIDPIDGTRSFMMGMQTWGTLIGLRYEGKPLIGMMNQPFTGERFWSDDASAHYAGPGGPRRLATRACPTLDHAILGSTHPDLFRESGQLEAFNRVKARVRMTRYGGDCLGYCLVAMGQVDLIIEANLQSYDIAALVPIIERAGGVVTTWAGGDAQYGGSIIAAGDPRLHEAALALLNA
ncbi:MAG: histidinol-phosphatase [Hyphomicrobiaceae bacterium]